MFRQDITTKKIFTGGMNYMKKTIPLVAAIVENNDGEILCALRSPQMSLPNHWEFSGGKFKKVKIFFRH